MRDDGIGDSGGYEVAASLLVTMKMMSATPTAAGVAIRFSTATEIDTVGFRILRSIAGNHEKGAAHAVPVSDLIPAAGSRLKGASYTFVDASRFESRSTQYWIEDVDQFGRLTRHGPIEVERLRASPR